jgi:hypothetical protein
MGAWFAEMDAKRGSREGLRKAGPWLGTIEEVQSKNRKIVETE